LVARESNVPRADDAGILEEERERARQEEIENLRAQHQAEFERVKGIMPSLEELRALSVEPSQELLDDEWQ